MHYKHTDESLNQIACELSAQYALEGTVGRYENKVRISAQLIEVKDQTQLWSREYDRKLSDILAAQSEVADDIGGEICLALAAKKGAKPAREAAFRRMLMKPTTST